MKLDAGLAVGGKYLPGIDELARAAEALGFAGLWTSETKHDSFLPLAVAAGATQKLDLGTSVAIAEGVEKEGRDPKDVQLATSVFVINREERSGVRGAARKDTRPGRFLEVHG